MKKCAKGGKVKEDDDMKGNKAEEKESGGKGFKRGGHVKHKKHGGKVGGKKPHGRPDKKARGGMASDVKSAAGMSPSSPLSGAGKTAEPKMEKNDKEDD